MKLKKLIAAASALCLIGSYNTLIVSDYNNHIVLKTQAAPLPLSGVCGDNATWSIDSNGILTISGSGKITSNSSINDHNDIITGAVIQGGITEICQGIFRQMPNLKYIEIKEGVSSIGALAIQNCANLTSITIPSTVTEIGANNFTSCPALEEINAADSNTYFTDINGVLIDVKKHILIRYPAGKKDISYTIPENVSSIYNYAFEDCVNLTEINIPETLGIINSYAFYGCDGLKNVTIPKSVEIIASGAFFCRNLESITIKNPECQIDDNPQTISNAFRGTYTYSGKIYGYSGSTAQKWAEENDITFSEISGSTLQCHLGDVNFDNHSDSDDASLVLAEYARKATQKPLQFSSQQNESADVNFDGNIDSDDASLILSYYAYTAVGGTQSPEEFFKK